MFQLDTNPQGIPRLGAEVRFGNRVLPGQSPNSVGQIASLLTNLGLSADVGTWLSGSLTQDVGGALLRAYTPGYNPAPVNESGLNDDPVAQQRIKRLKQEGGFVLEADFAIDGFFGQAQGDATLTVTPDSVSGTFHGDGQLDFPNLVSQIGQLIGIDSPAELFSVDLPDLDGVITEHGCLAIQVGEPFNQNAAVRPDPWRLLAHRCDP